VLTSIFIRISEFFSADLRRQKFGGGFSWTNSANSAAAWGVYSVILCMFLIRLLCNVHVLVREFVILFAAFVA